MIEKNISFANILVDLQGHRHLLQPETAQPGPALHER